MRYFRARKCCCRCEDVQLSLELYFLSRLRFVLATGVDHVTSAPKINFTSYLVRTNSPRTQQALLAMKAVLIDKFVEVC